MNKTLVDLIYEQILKKLTEINFDKRYCNEIELPMFFINSLSTKDKYKLNNKLKRNVKIRNLYGSENINFLNFK